MKKKGLIIATIVMILVLAVSLTTATYAWFAATASATISSMNIVTTASQGLQIASVVNTGSALNYYNGQLTLGSTATKWAQYSSGDSLAEETGFGSELQLQESEGVLINNMFGASGDGVTMFKQANPNLTDDISVLNPAALAVENTNYLALDFAITATANGTAYINQIYVNPSSTKSGMAGSMRIALFATAAGDAQSSLPTWSVASNGKMLYEPYGSYTYGGAAFNTNDETNYYYTAAGHTLKYYAESDTSESGYVIGSDSTIAALTALKGTFNETKYYKEVQSTQAYDVVARATSDSAGKGTLSSTTLQATWGDAKLVYGSTTDPSGKTLNAAGNSTAYADKTAADAVIKNNASTPAAMSEIGQMTTGQIIYLRLVVWFDGESSACRQEFAGGGATVQINFSLQAA